MNMRELLFQGVSQGCSDHNCIITGKKTGMGTNGGCRCLLNLNRSQLNILKSRLVAILDQGKYAIVPVEPTNRMLKAAIYDTSYDAEGDYEATIGNWKAMVAAAQEDSE